jgi:hypothetical protein
MRNIVLALIAVVSFCGCSMSKKLGTAPDTRNVIFEEEDTQRLRTSRGAINMLSKQNTRLLRREANKFHTRKKTVKKKISDFNDLNNNIAGYVYVEKKN